MSYLLRRCQGKNVMGTVKVSKKIVDFKKRIGYLCILCYEMEVASLFNT